MAILRLPSSRRSRLARAAGGILAIAATAAFAFDWPDEDGLYRYGFGTFRAGFLLGSEYGAEEGLARASADGELVFAATSPVLPGGYPLSGGSLAAIAHASDIMTLYSGLEPDSLAAYLRRVRKGDVLGKGLKAETTSGGRAAVSYVFDAKERRYINPLIVLPARPDDKPPVIRSVALESDGGEQGLDRHASVRQGSYRILVEAGDASPAGTLSAPYEVRVLIDGSERTRIVYDAAWATGGTRLLFGASSLREEECLTTDGRLRLGPYSLARGKVVITVAATDFSGNKRELTYQVSVF